MNWTLKNTGANTVPPHSVVKLTGISVRSNGKVYLEGEKPDSAANFLLAITGAMPIAEDQYGRCEPCAPVLIVKYDTGGGTPANLETWGPDNGTFKFKKNFGDGQFVVVGVDTDKEIIAAMHVGTITRLGKTDSSVSASSTGTVSLWSGALDSETDTGDNVSSVLNRGDAIDSGIWVEVKYRNGGWEMVPLECNA